MISRCVDRGIIKPILTHPQVWDWVNDDTVPENFEPEISPRVIYIIDETEKRMVMVNRMNSITCTVHMAMLPEVWGTGVMFARDAIAWGFRNTPYLKIVAFIPEYNERVIKMVRKIGFTEEGRITKSFMKRWKLHDQLAFGLTKGGFTCQ